MRITVIGADGQLGTDICKALIVAEHEVIGLTIADLDIVDMDSVSRVLEETRAQVVINTAAFHHTEKCEIEAVKAFEVNALGPRNLATISNKLGAALVQISTDYVFDGKKRTPYIESDRPMPLNVYANTKLAGEYFVEAIAKRFYILRVSGIYGTSPCIGKGGMNFVELMLKLSREREEVKVVDNEFLTPTSTVEISRQIVTLIEKEPVYGLYHCTAQGSCSWYEFAAEIFAVTQPKIRFLKAAPGEFAVKVNRPEYSVLENHNLQNQGIDILRHWKEGLREYLANKGYR